MYNFVNPFISNLFKIPVPFKPIDKLTTNPSEAPSFKSSNLITDYIQKDCKPNFDAKMTMPDSQWHTRNLYLINTVIDIDVFLRLKVFHSNNSNIFSCRRNVEVAFIENPLLTTIIFGYNRLTINI